MSKYNNVKTKVDGITFDSKKEARRYQELKLLQRAGEIRDLELQKKYLLIPEQREKDMIVNGKKKKGKLTQRATYYVADFVYFDVRKNKWIVEDVKGYRTEVYKLKKKLFEYIYETEIFET